jgi:transposase
MSSKCGCPYCNPAIFYGQSRLPQGSAIRRAIRAVDARLVLLPAYSPDLNPIEQVFRKAKILLRKAKERTIEGVWRRIGNLLQHFTPQECANYLHNAGYASI